MATAFGEDEFEDFITCTVCISEYDTIDKKPKFLQCSHTACLACLKVALICYINYSKFLIYVLTDRAEDCREFRHSLPALSPLFRH